MAFQGHTAGYGVDHTALQFRRQMFRGSGSSYDLRGLDRESDKKAESDTQKTLLA